VTPANSLSFLPAVAYDSGGDYAYRVVIADVNGDSKPDLVVANLCGKSSNDNCSHGLVNGAVGVLVGNGDGTFLPAVSYDSSGLQALSVAVADLNGDGKLDLIVTNRYACANICPDGSVDVRLGNGDGTFQSAVASYDAGGCGTWSVSVADVDGDGSPDIILANNCFGSGGTSSTVSVLLGKGDGTFESAVEYASGLSAWSVAVADVNGDGQPDLLVGSCASSGCESGTVAVLLGKGDGTFQAAVSYDSGGSQAISVAVADVNGDGKPDLLVANYYPTSSVGVLLGNGDGTFQPAVAYESGGQQPISIAVADVDRDGKPDLLVANVAYSVGILLGNGDGTFQTALNYGSGGLYPLSIAAADLNGDSEPDLVVGNTSGAGSTDGSVGVLLNNTTLSQSTTTTTLASSRNHSFYGQPVTFTATVTTLGPIAPTGTVNFRSGSQGIGTGTLDAGGVATFTTSNLKPGLYRITALYNGDASNLHSISAVLYQGVKRK
jgi:uncharacterized protein (UPF0548 family)